jgi:hypothetical protein
MQNLRSLNGYRALLIVMIVALVFVGCAAPSGPDQPTETLLPRITLNFDEQGVPSVLGISLDMISGLIGQDLSTIRLAPELIQQLMAAGVQHIELVVTNDAIHIFVNGDAMPYLSMDEETWETLGQVAPLLGIPMWDTVQMLRENVLSRFGVPLALTFPVAAGEEPIPLRDPGTLPQVDEEAARSAAGDPDVTFHAGLDVDSSGLATVAGLPVAVAQLDPALVATLGAAGIQHFQMETEPEGLYIYFNGEPLPRISWDQERLENLAAFYQGVYGSDPNVPVINMMLPALGNTDLEVTLFLPVPEGMEEVPIRSFQQD